MNELSEKAAGYLSKLCVEIDNRRVGSEGNRQAVSYFEVATASFGFKIERHEFECMDWVDEGATLQVGSKSFEVKPSPYSLGCRVQAPLVVISSVEELEGADLGGKIALLRGEIAKEQLMPKNFPFYNPEHHQHTIGLLESKAPLAIIAATDKDPGLAGGISPFPLIEDGDFDIPSVYLHADAGDQLQSFAGETVILGSKAQRIPAKGWNAVARIGESNQNRIVVTAHIDAKTGTPGALDNATGVTILLLLAELLADYTGKPGIELIAINGEDYYSAIGEVKYLEHNQDSLAQIKLNINIDGVGFKQGGTAFSLYECPEAMAEGVRKAFAKYTGLLEGEIWYSGDHMVFVMNGVPAVALTSEHGMSGLAQVSHTPKDRPELVDAAKLVEAALAIRELIEELGAGDI